MHESKILIKLNTCHEQDVEGADNTEKNPIKRFIVVIRFVDIQNRQDMSNIKFVNEEEFGWRGIIVDDYQKAVKELKNIV